MTKLIKSIGIGISAMFAPAVPLFMAVGLAIFADTVSGVWKVKKNKQTFDSKKLRLGLVSKMLAYQGVVATMFLLDVWILGEFMALFNDINLVATKLVCMGLISIEVISINENFQEVTGKSIMQGIKAFINSYNDIKKDL